MKTLHIKRVFLQVEDNKVIREEPDFNKQGQEHISFFEFSWICGKCKYKHFCRVQTKPTYLDSDIITTFRSGFLLPFYQCNCNSEAHDGRKVKEPIGSISCAADNKETRTKILSAKRRDRTKEINK